MNYFTLLTLTTLGFFLTACSETENKTSSLPQSSTESVTPQLDMGKDRRMVLNDTLLIEPKAVSNLNEVASYLWQYKGDSLATTRRFTYTATTLGVHLLNFSVTYNDGKVVSDTLKVIVTSEEIDVSIPKISETLKAKYLTAINNARATAQDCGSKGKFSATTKLTWNEKLYSAAYQHTQDLVKSQTFEHEGSGTQSDWTGYALNKKSNLIERAEAYGYKWHRLAENLAGGMSMNDAQKAVDSWLESDYHCENLMNPNFTEVGMVMVKDEDSKYIHYWSQKFGTPK